jgi:DNA invertase Pin-like site-specific DNA recombinase
MAKRPAMSAMSSSVVRPAAVPGRFSTPEQAKGNSYRRQTERASAYCQRRGWTLDDILKADLGVSAFRGKNALVGNLRASLDAVTAGTVRKGSALIYRYATGVCCAQERCRRA